ncbi:MULTISPECIES: aldolase [unclassified Leucobacter]|uniref:DUF6986 family protein n=1 Tax=unclassified Leucobacter TaxID=2621730 RepID=UPI00165DC9E1|nr:MULTISPECIES: aldolase [unclassified Leucobacter]MBC9936529.1 aldolase [Leucobacter sp. cx-87]
MNEIARAEQRLAGRLALDDARVGAERRAERLPRISPHVAYVPADQFHSRISHEWAATAHAAVQRAGGYERLGEALGSCERARAGVAARVEAKMLAGGIEDLRVDFEDGYGTRLDETEDLHAQQAGAEAAKLEDYQHQVGLRIKSMEPDTRARGIRTLTLFLRSLTSEVVPRGPVLITLPKVTSMNQADAFCEFVEVLEGDLGLPARALLVEIQVEAPRIISQLLTEGAFNSSQSVRSGRISGLHFGTYDYGAALKIDPFHQRLDHPSADFAKLVMQLAVSETDVRLSDGSSNRIPVPADNFGAWTEHASLVQRSLRRGITQGWDIHPLQLPSRYFAVYDYYRSGLQEAIARINDYLAVQSLAVLDEPASARALAAFLLAGVQLGAVDAEEITSQLEADWSQLLALAAPAFQQTIEGTE